MSNSSSSDPRPRRLSLKRTGSRPSARSARGRGARSRRTESGAGTGAAPPVQGRHTGAIPTQGRGTGAIPVQGRGTGSLPVQGCGTGSMPVQGRGTGSIPVQGRHTGSIPTQGRHTGSIPTQGRHTGSIPTQGRGTGAIPVQGRHTGSLPRNMGTIPSDSGFITQGTGVHQRLSQPERRRVNPFIVAGSIVAGAAVVGVMLFALTRCLFGAGDRGPIVEPGQPVEVVIPQGAGGDVIVNALAESGVISDGTAFMQAVSSLGADQKLQPGTYRLTTGMDVDAVVHQLMAGPNTSAGRLTVPEGLTVQRTAEVVQEALGIPVDEFLAQAKASNFVDDYDFLAMAADDSLEGFLWAKTYDFSGREVSADAVIRAMLDQYRSEIPVIDFSAGEARIQRDYGIEMNDYQILILASIIQGEIGKPEDADLVASTFYNRLRDGMRLQSDATSSYVTEGEPTPEDLQTDGPYNTYTRDGLPPTPICTPDLACIEAALDPAVSDYFYFLLIERDGYSNHTFSKTYEEHEQAIEKARQDLAALGQ